VGFGGAVGRLAELRERQRRLQFEAARLLLLRDGDCREKSLLGRRFIRRTALEENLAAQTMQESIAPVFSILACESQRCVDLGQGSRCAALSFDLGK
jgi:hypothetical protein